MSDPVSIVGGIVGGASLVEGVLGDDPAEVAADQRNNELARQQALWERQFGPVSDALKAQMMSMLGQGPVQPESPWLTQYKEKMRSEIEGGIRPGEEAARTALLDKVRANPAGMSNQAYTKGLKDFVIEGAKARGNAFRSGMSQAELAPFNMGLSFMRRTPYQPAAPYSPDYKDTSIDRAKAVGSGLYETVQGGKSLYNDLYGNRAGSGFETTGPGVFPGATSSDLLEYGWD